MGRGTHRGFITYEELSKSLGKRNLSDDNLSQAFMHILDESKSVSGAIRYDPKLRTFPYWSGLLTIRKPTGWEWSVYLSQRRGTARENDLSWGLGVNLFSF